VLDAQLEGRVRSHQEAVEMVRREFPLGRSEDPGAHRAD